MYSLMPRSAASLLFCLVLAMHSTMCEEVHAGEQHNDILERSLAADCSATGDAATVEDDESPTSAIALAPTRIS
jgi:hypothetical protein